MEFTDIEQALIRYLEPEQKLVISERAKFFSVVQQASTSISEFVVSLRAAARHCQFEDLKKNNGDIVEEMIKMRLVSGLLSNEHKFKLLEYLQNNSTASVRDMTCFLQNVEQSKKFVESVVKIEEQIETNHTEVPPRSRQTKRQDKVGKDEKKCTFCGRIWHNNLMECPARNRSCKSCGKRGHFAAMCKSKTNYIVESDDESPESCLFVGCHSIGEKRVKIRVKGRDIEMQVDTGACRSIISSTIWKRLGKPQLTRCAKRPVAYDGTTLKCLGLLNVDIEFENKFMIVDFMIIESPNNFGLLGRDLISGDDQPKMEKTSKDKINHVNFLPTIKGIKASMKLKPGATDRFCSARPVPIALEEKVANELKKLEAMGVITKCEQGGVANASSSN